MDLSVEATDKESEGLISLNSYSSTFTCSPSTEGSKFLPQTTHSSQPYIYITEVKLS